jgi:IS5 family transposase
MPESGSGVVVCSSSVLLKTRALSSPIGAALPLIGVFSFARPPLLSVAGAGVSAAGRPRLPIRLMVSLLYLKHAFNESDESVVQRWSENVVWQFFSGMEYYSPKLPCDAAQISRFRKILGEAGVEQLLKTTIEAAVAMKAVKKSEFERVAADNFLERSATTILSG